jgi:2-amino-4-hydroxy-6-hydroxymethyldihydropteridine diphosphokinase
VIRQQRLRVEHPAVLSLGSNLGDRETTIRRAIHDIAALPDVVVVATSGLVETPALKPDGVDVDAPAYLNAAVAVRTALEPEALLAALNGIERDHGRVRDVRWGDRTLDIDIVAMGARRVSSETLTVPHPRAGDRAFVLAPWLEIEPDAVLPGRGRVDALLAVAIAEAGGAPVPYAAEALS